MTEIWQWNTATTVAEVGAGSVSAREVTQAHLDRLDAVNPALNAVTNDVRDHALATAASLDEAFASSGAVGPLHGVPVTIKENIDVEGQVTPNGIPAFADLVAPSNSPLVDHLQAAGAVIVGRTNAPEMSYRWHTTNPLRGETKNPWSPNRTPGGSSGGAAAAVVSGIGTIGHGNDLGGSIRQPANCCGLVGLRPSLGRVPAQNDSATGARTMALQLMSVQGPLTREVADARLAFEVMAQRSHRDPWHRSAPLVPADAEPAGPLRIAATYGTPSSPTDDEVRQAVDLAAAHLIDAGHEVVFVDPPHLDEIRIEWRAILATETMASIWEQVQAVTSDEFNEVVGWMFEDEAILDLAGYVGAFSRRATILRDWLAFLEEHPLLIAPVSQRVPFAPNADASSRDEFMEIFHGHTPLVAVNYLGLPGVAVPVHLSADGPNGVQLIGRPFREDQCLDAAQQIETRTGVMAPHLWSLEVT